MASFHKTKDTGKRYNWRNQEDDEGSNASSDHESVEEVEEKENEQDHSEDNESDHDDSRDTGISRKSGNDHEDNNDDAFSSSNSRYPDRHQKQVRHVSVGNSDDSELEQDKEDQDNDSEAEQDPDSDPEAEQDPDNDEEITHTKKPKVDISEFFGGSYHVITYSLQYKDPHLQQIATASSLKSFNRHVMPETAVSKSWINGIETRTINEEPVLSQHGLPIEGAEGLQTVLEAFLHSLEKEWKKSGKEKLLLVGHFGHSQFLWRLVDWLKKEKLDAHRIFDNVVFGDSRFMSSKMRLAKAPSGHVKYHSLEVLASYYLPERRYQNKFNSLENSEVLLDLLNVIANSHPMEDGVKFKRALKIFTLKEYQEERESKYVRKREKSAKRQKIN